MKTIFFFCIVLAVSFAELQAVNPPQITKQPENGTFAKGATVRFYVNASSTDGGYLTYEWFRSERFPSPLGNPNGTDKTTVTATNHSEGTRATLTTTAPNVAGYYYYRAVITNHKNGLTESVESRIVEAKVVDKNLSPTLVLGDFEDFVGVGKTAINDIGVRAIVNYWPSTIYPFTWNSTINEEHANDRGSASDNKNGVGKTFDIQIHNTWRGDGKLSDGKHGKYSIEIAPFYAASAYQEIATVPGKIYEWSFDHACRSSSRSPDVMALIIGPAINEESDYGKYLSGEPNYWNKVNAATNPIPFISAFSVDGDYPYGVNDQCKNRNPKANDTYFLAILNRMMADQNLTKNKLPSVANNSTGFATNYFGKDYYVYIASTGYNEAWKTKSGAYTIPSGQGTTVYAWLDISQHDGNIVDNITFASGRPLLPTQDISYTSDAQLSVATLPDYVYGIAEIRGSTAMPVAGVSAYYDSDGDGTAAFEQPISANENNWYIKNGGFADTGIITFKNLVPGKVYRIVGIPANAINAGLHVNERPSYVLDEGYCHDTRILPAHPGDESTIWNINLEIVSGKARISIENALDNVEYALLAGDATAPNTAAPAHGWTAWTAGENGTVTFDRLSLNTHYYLVARPADYTEVSYGEAAEAYILVRTPAETNTIQDVDPAAVSRSVDGYSIGLAASTSGCEYAVVDPKTGAIIGAVQSGNGNELHFAVPDSGKTYRIMVRSGEINWMKGVRVYPYPDPFSIDYLNEMLKSDADPEHGNIPLNVEYRIVCRGENLFGNDAWETGIRHPADLGALTLNNKTQSILDRMAELDADALLTYRIRPGWDGYEGAMHTPTGTLTIPKRPASPTATGDYHFDYSEEKIIVNADSLHFAPIGTSNWLPRTKTDAWTFADAGWGDGDSPKAFRLRIPATAAAFASSPNHTDTIPARPAAPAVGATSNGSSISIIGLDAGISYQYRESAAVNWIDVTPGATAIPLLAAGNGESYRIRLSATPLAPASFPATVVATPIGIQAISFTYDYRPATADEQEVVITNYSLETFTSLTVALKKGAASPFTLKPWNGFLQPQEINRQLKLGSNAILNAGTYRDTLILKYTDASTTAYTATAEVRLTVNKIHHDITPLTASILHATAERLLLKPENIPAGATLRYYFATEPVPPATIEVDAAGNILFKELTPRTVYDIRAVAVEDVNHYESSRKPLLLACTAHDTPDFDATIEIDYHHERLLFRNGFTPGNYTVTYGSDTIRSPWSLTNILDTLSGNTFTLSVVHNAGVSPPYPASAAATSGAVGGRSTAPTAATSTPSGSHSSLGTVHLHGQYQYRVHGSTEGWQSAVNETGNLGAGYYDLRLPATDTETKKTFASHFATLLVPQYANAQWTGNAGSADWNTPANWTVDGPAGWTAPADFIPNPATNVRIPGREMTHFPRLTAAASCDNIYILPGAQLGQQQHLNYNRAYVQFDLGLKGDDKQVEDKGATLAASPSEADFTARHLAFSAGHSGDSLARDRWYMLSPPLQKMVSGDFAFGDYPRVFMRKFNNVHPSPDGRHVGQWTTTFATLAEPLNPMEGFALWVNGYRDTYGYREGGNENSHHDPSVLGGAFGLKQQNGILELPFFENDTLSKARRIHKYEDGASKFHYIWTADPLTGNIVDYRYDTCRRTEDAYRFVGHGNYEHLNYTGLPATGGTVLLGNPFVGAIDFTAFCNDNASAMNGTVYRLWNGNQFADIALNNGNYLITGGSIDGHPRYIAPMQSFLLTVKAGAGSLKFNVANSSVSTPNVPLRSAPVEENTLRLSAVNTHFSSQTLIARREHATDDYHPEEDLYKLFSQKTYVPEIYTIADRYALAMNFIEGNREILIPIGLKTTFHGNTHLHLTGMNRYQAARIEFMDTNANFTKDITGEERYEYHVTHLTDDVTEERFFLRIHPPKTTPTHPENEKHGGVYAFRRHHEIHVIASSDNPLRQVAVYNLQGRELYRQTPLDADRCTIRHLSHDTPLLLRIVTAYGTTNLKLLK
jgi:hypothetical protein